MQRLSFLPILLLAGACAAPRQTAAPSAPFAPESEVAPEPAAPAPTAAATEAAPRAGTDLVLHDLAGVEHRVDASLEAGRPVALVFWQTWCGPCRRESPELVRAAEELAGKIDFYGIVPGADDDVDDDEVLRTAESWHLPYPQVRDRDLTLTQRFGVQGTPDILVLSSGGEVVYRGHAAPADWNALL